MKATLFKGEDKQKALVSSVFKFVMDVQENISTVFH